MTTEVFVETAPAQDEWRDPFVSYLEDLRERADRGALAAMRRWLARSAGDRVEAMRVVQPQLAMNDGRTRENVTHLIAALFALHDLPGGVGNMGDHFRKLCTEGEPRPPNVENRFMALLASDADDFDVALRQAVMLLKSKDVPVNWHRLIGDAMAWKGYDDDRRERVRSRWAQHFWRSPAPATAESHADTEDAKQPIN